eukprot:TRINITY_DN6541_c0_g1_i1.p1 TRINITY_DN6541_c0_g1~~TRINITY_DN6541_c0_g1_i1.p1  ORF type:complete len:566 (-),score=104.62 TRINITY_DN6541_c0_g1_i1:424-2121(-)
MQCVDLGGRRIIKKKKKKKNFYQSFFLFHLLVMQMQSLQEYSQQYSKQQLAYETPSNNQYSQEPSTADSMKSISMFSESDIKQKEKLELHEQNELLQFIDNIQLTSQEEMYQKSINDLNQLHLGFPYTINQKKSDRFIPNRKASKLYLAFTEAHESDENRYDEEQFRPKQCKDNQPIQVVDIYKSQVLGVSNQPTTKNNNIFRFNDSPTKQKRKPLCHIQDPIMNTENIAKQFEMSKKTKRKISKIPFKVLDAPALQDDFYLNLIDWSQENMLAVALSSCVYLWSATTNKVIKFCDLGSQDMVTSVGWNPKGNALSIGTSMGDLQIWDAVKLKKCYTLPGHSARIGSIAWSNLILSTGSRDKTILFRDLRQQQNYIRKLQGHKQEVCGLKWSTDDQQLASGGNDNKLNIWNLHSSTPVGRFGQHKAAVKALAWSPHQHGLLASGGGTADRTIRFWNTLNNQQLFNMDTGSQVCNLMFGKNVNELISTHGYSLNEINIWKYPTMEKIADLTGHTSRVLFLAMSPCGQIIVTGAGDETLRFWNVFPKKNEGITYQSSILIEDARDLR